jgi:FKBP-type peptidyl-prolyl cis-trans isomerase (trigger factor)
MEDLKTEWRPYAEKKAKLQLIINRIAEVENIRPSKEDIDGEVSVILSQYKDADREKATVYAETVLTNEKVFQFLEGQSE